MESKPSPVVLLLADISGYTKFMLSHAKAPVHSQMIISGLFETLMRQIDHPLKIVELEGDALFLYAPKTQDVSTWSRRGQRLVDRILQLFEIFNRRVAELQAYSVCRCGACANLDQLKLKVVAHSGHVLMNRVGEFSRLSGIDVITVHRLLKNSVAESQYLLMSEPARDDLPLPEGCSLVEGSESYDVGTVRTFTYVPEIEPPDPDAFKGTFAEDNVAVQILRHEIQQEYTEVACEPDRGYHFKTGRAAAETVEYDPAWLEGIPETVVESFAGTGNPFSLGDLHPGDHVVDVGSGSGLDSLIAGRMVGPDGHVIGVDMTAAMMDKARAGAEALQMTQVEFRDGHAEALPVPDGWADVVISNGVVNLSPDKAIAFGEMMRVLRPGGRLQIADISVQKVVPEGARRDIDLWTN